MRIFLNQTPEEKRETIEENLMYKTKENKKGSFNVDLIMDNKDLMDEDKKVDNCLQRPFFLDPQFIRPPLTREQRMKKPPRHRCNYPKSDYVKPFISMCAEDEVDTKPYCDRLFIHWIIREHPKFKNRRQIILKEKGITNRCELEDYDYFLEIDILKKKRDIKRYDDMLRFSKTYRTSPEFEKQKKKINEEIDTINEKEVKVAQDNYDDEAYSKATEKVKKLEKK